MENDYEDDGDSQCCSGWCSISFFFSHSKYSKPQCLSAAEGFWIFHFSIHFFPILEKYSIGGTEKGAGLQSFPLLFWRSNISFFLSFLFPLTDPFRDAWSFDRPSNRLAATDDFPLFPSLFLGAQHCFLYPPVRHFSCSWPLPLSPPFRTYQTAKKREAMKTKLVRFRCVYLVGDGDVFLPVAKPSGPRTEIVVVAVVGGPVCQSTTT